MKMTESILTQLTDTNAILDAVYETIATLDPNYGEEMETYHEGLQALTQAVNLHGTMQQKQPFRKLSLSTRLTMKTQTMPQTSLI